MKLLRVNKAEQLVMYFNQIDEKLRSEFKISRDKPFSTVLKIAGASNPFVRQNEPFLREIADLRNLLVHHVGYPLNQIAYPSDQTLVSIGKIVERLVRPKNLYQLINNQSPKTYTLDSSLAIAIEEMTSRDFSQVVVNTTKSYILLTSEGIRRWLKSKIMDDLVSLQDARIADAVSLEKPGTFSYLARTSTVEEARQLFSLAPKPDCDRLLAIIVTESGKPSEKPLGIVTVWDLLETDE